MKSLHKAIQEPKKWVQKGIEYRCERTIGSFLDLDPVWEITDVHFQIMIKIDWPVMRDISWKSGYWHIRLIGWLRSWFI